MAKCFESINSQSGEPLEPESQVGEPVNQLSSYDFCRQGAAADFRANSVGDGSAGDLLGNGDGDREAVMAQVDAVMERFASLPAAYREQVIGSFAPHMTGEEYPLYDHIRNYRPTTA